MFFEAVNAVLLNLNQQPVNSPQKTLQVLFWRFSIETGDSELLVTRQTHKVRQRHP